MSVRFEFVEITPPAPVPNLQPTVAEMLSLHERGIEIDAVLRQGLGEIVGITPETASGPIGSVDQDAQRACF